MESTENDLKVGERPLTAVAATLAMAMASTTIMTVKGERTQTVWHYLQDRGTEGEHQGRLPEW
jgi:hypothetical protein